MRGKRKEITDAEYVRQVRQMARLAKEWMETHPHLEAKVQFNFPEHVMIIGEIDLALKRKFITCNEHGLALLKAMITTGTETAFMAQMALDGLHQGLKP